VFFDLFMKRLMKLGTLYVRLPDGAVRTYGSGQGPVAGFSIASQAALRRLGLNPALALGEGYMEGDILPENCSLHELLDLLTLNLMQGGAHPAEKAMEWARWTKRRLDQFNPAPRARRNVAHHYDLNARLYALFLDRDRQYSCAYFQTGNESLEEAQVAKKRHIAAKLRLDRPRRSRASRYPPNNWRWRAHGRKRQGFPGRCALP
jgi:cyclopropane-fatty-acyl-phospholipid synthase